MEIESIRNYKSVSEFSELLKVIKTYISKNEDIEFVTRAFNFAYEKHKDQFRKSGEPYIIHPLQVAYILSTIELDESTICAALLHDIVEDTSYTFEDLSNMGFPIEVIDVLKLLTHKEDVPYMEYVKKLSVNNTARKVKIADLKHNSDLTRLDLTKDKIPPKYNLYLEAIKILEE